MMRHLSRDEMYAVGIPLVRRLVGKRSRTREEFEERLSEAHLGLCHLVESGKRFESVPQLEAYLSLLCRHRLARHLPRAEVSATEVLDDGLSPEELTCRAEIIGRVWAAVDLLWSPLAEIVRCRFQWEMSLRGIGEVVGLAASNVHACLRKALDVLRWALLALNM